MRVYVAGPYTKPDCVLNTNRAIGIAEALVKRGHTPYIPHLALFWHLVSPHPYKFWLEYDMVWLRQCDAVFRFDGESAGADLEIEVANRRGIPVWYSIEEVPDES